MRGHAPVARPVRDEMIDPKIFLLLLTRACPFLSSSCSCSNAIFISILFLTKRAYTCLACSTSNPAPVLAVKLTAAWYRSVTSCPPSVRLNFW